jgi:hypothetical protein
MDKSVASLLNAWIEKKERYDDAVQAYFPAVANRDRTASFRVLSEETLNEIARLEREMREAHGIYLQALRASEVQKAVS